MSHTASTVNMTCPNCKTNHLLYQCPSFLQQTPSQRFEFLKRCKRYINCFSVKHSAKDCTSLHTCKQCHKKHHTLLHFKSSMKPTVSEQASNLSPNNNKTESNITAHLLSKSVSIKYNILVATARVRVYSSQGRYVNVRVLLDQGSVSTLISETLVQSLRLPKTKLSVCITGIGRTQSVMRHAAEITITPASHELRSSRLHDDRFNTQIAD